MSELWMCEAIGCERRADWAYIGEGGDLFICSFHGGSEPIAGWKWIGEGSPPAPSGVEVEEA